MRGQEDISAVFPADLADTADRIKYSAEPACRQVSLHVFDLLENEMPLFFQSVFL
jgi:hypothetical protein